MKKIGPWTQKSSKIVYQNKWLIIHEDQIIHPDGKDGMYSVVDTHPAVFIVAMNDKNEIHLNKQSFLATDLEFSGDSKLEEEGISDVKFFPIKKVNEMIKQGLITDALSITPIYQALIHINHFG